MPAVMIGLTTRRVLVTEYLDGVPMATYMRAREDQRRELRRDAREAARA